MMKGKKFNAAERYFEKLKLKYEKQIKELLERAERDHGEIRYYRRVRKTRRWRKWQNGSECGATSWGNKLMRSM